MTRFPRRWEKRGYRYGNWRNPDWVNERIREIELTDYAVDLDRQKAIGFQRMERNLGDKGQHLLNYLSHTSLATYAWPGGYQVIYLTDNDECLCPDCANRELQTLWNDDNTGEYLPVEGYVYYEGPAERCHLCDREIESAYGDPDAVDELED